MDKDKINRINVLAKKSKEIGLDESEKAEQINLRNEYVRIYRESLRSQLNSIKVVDKDGNDITPEKLKEAKNKNSFNSNEN